MNIEFSLQAVNDNGSYDDLRQLYHHLVGEHELRKDVHVSPQLKPVPLGEQGAMEVLTVVAAVAAVGQVAVAVRAWRDQLKRPTTVQLVVSGEYQEHVQPIREALHGSGQPEVRHETGTVGANGVGRIVAGSPVAGCVGGA